MVELFRSLIMTSDNPYRNLPSVDRLLAHQRIRALSEGQTTSVTTQLVRQALETARAAIAQGQPPPSEEQIVETVLGLAETLFHPSLRPIINATGVIIHTNLGRAPLSDDAIAAMATVSHSYSNLEFDLPAGERFEFFQRHAPALGRLGGEQPVDVVHHVAHHLSLAVAEVGG